MSFSFPLSTEAALLRQSLRQQIVALSSDALNREAFNRVALAVFQYQATYNFLYRTYLQHLNCRPEQITDLHQVPFMPISFFKHHPILSGIDTNHAAALTSTRIFASSGTTSRNAGADQTSRHYVPDLALYDTISIQLFERTYGSLHDFHVLALLPSYLERNNSSLVYMVQQFMTRSEGGQNRQTDQSRNGFFLNNYVELTNQLRKLAHQSKQTKILLIGVTFGLLDWAESGEDLGFLSSLPNLIVMETGGMKGRRKELLREEVHAILTQQLGVPSIHSEYGMTELLSQAYSVGEGIFRPSATLRVFLRDINDPFYFLPDADEISLRSRQTGGINVVDLANLDSCAFIETQDLGQYVDTEGNFRVIGRFDNSDVRGCNLMVV